MGEIVTRTSKDVHDRARQVSVRLSRANPKTGMWLFQARGSKGTYTIRLKGIRQGNVINLTKAQVKVSCTCDFFRWQGPEHWAKTNGYLYGRPRGNAQSPQVKDPKAQHWACKHILAAFNLSRHYRMAHQGGQWWPRGAEVVPEWSSPNRVAERWLNHTRN